MTRRLFALLAVSLLLPLSACESDILLTPSARPERLYAVSNAAGVLLYWDAIPGATGYRVYVRHVEGTDFELAEERPTNFAFVGFSGTDAVYLTVSALRGNDESAKSPEILGVKQPEHVSPNHVIAVTSTAAGFASAIESVGDTDGDGFEDVLVGAPLAAGGAGVVYLYRGAAGGLNPAPRVIATGSSGALLGTSIAYSETFLDAMPVAIVGAPGGAGAAYLFPRLGSAEPFGVLSALPTQGAPGSGFGSVVVAAGNLDGLVPVREEVAVSAPDAAGGEGRVYVFQGGATDTDGIGVFAVVEVTPETVTSASRFGFSLAAAGNLETDPEDDLLIGAPGHANIGAVAVLSGDIAMFATTGATAAFTAYGSEPGSQFGWSVTSLGDPDSDDRDEYAVGSPQDDCDEAGEGKGSVMVVNPGAGEGYAIACGEPGDHFGYSLERAGTVFNDEEQFLAGSYSTSGDGRFALAHWRLDAEQTPIDGQLERFEPAGFTGGGYGRVLASADVNGDGRPDVLVGIPEASTMHVFVTIPENGPEVLLGGPIDAVEGAPVSFSSAFINDTVTTSYSCSVLWGDEPDAGAATFVDECTTAALRELEHAYVITDPEGDGRQDFFATVYAFSLDGRSGTAVTRVRVRP